MLKHSVSKNLACSIKTDEHLQFAAKSILRCDNGLAKSLAIGSLDIVSFKTVGFDRFRHLDVSVVHHFLDACSEIVSIDFLYLWSSDGID